MKKHSPKNIHHIPAKRNIFIDPRCKGLCLASHNLVNMYGYSADKSRCPSMDQPLSYHHLNSSPAPSSLWPKTQQHQPKHVLTEGYVQPNIAMQSQPTDNLSNIGRCDSILIGLHYRHGGNLTWFGPTIIETAWPFTSRYDQSMTIIAWHHHLAMTRGSENTDILPCAMIWGHRHPTPPTSKRGPRPSPPPLRLPAKILVGGRAAHHEACMQWRAMDTSAKSK